MHIGLGISLTNAALLAGGGYAPDEDEVFSASIVTDGPLFTGPVSVSKITRTGGTSQTVALYDHAVSATGSVVFSQAMAPAAIVEFSPPLQFINGVYVDVSVGDGSVDFEVAA